MPAPKWVKKRDGRPEPYEEGKVARAIALAAKDAGRRDGALDLARELARSVTFFLGRGEARTPETRAIAEAVYRALEETGHSAAADRFREHREWRSARRAAVRVREAHVSQEPPQDAVAAVEVLSAGGASPWSKRRIVEALTHEAGLAEESAEDVARAVEDRVFSSGLKSVGSSLLRELVDAELFERGFSAQLQKLEVVGVAKPALRRLVFLEGVRAPASIEREIARAALERYTLDDLLGGEAAQAHRSGDVHLVGLGRPLRLAGGAASAVDVVEAGTGGKPAGTVLEAVRALVRAARAGIPAYDVAFGLSRVDLALASWARDPGLGQAIEVLLDGIVAPSFEEAVLPDLVLTAVAADPSRDARRVRDALIEAMAARGQAAAGARLALVTCATCTKDADARGAIERTVAAARAGAPVELALLPEGAHPSASRGHAGLSTARAATQIACLNFARVALDAGRGERGRLSEGIARAVEASLEGLHAKRRLAVSAITRPALPLWAPRGKDAGSPPGVRPRALDPDALVDVVTLVGLDAGLRYFAGESPAENPRVAALAREVVGEILTLARAEAGRFGLTLRFEDAPAGEAPERLAALDIERYEDARELVEGRGGWDPGLALGPVGQDPVPGLPLRIEIARACEASLALPRSALATADPKALADTATKALAAR